MVSNNICKFEPNWMLDGVSYNSIIQHVCSTSHWNGFLFLEKLKIDMFQKPKLGYGQFLQVNKIGKTIFRAKNKHGILFYGVLGVSFIDRMEFTLFSTLQTLFL